MTERRHLLDAGLERWAGLLLRRPWWVLAVSLALAAGLAAQVSRLRVDASTEGFLHEDDPVRIVYDEFRDQFGRDDRIVIALRPRDIFALDFLGRLRGLHERLENEVPHVRSVTSLINARVTRAEDDFLIVEELLGEEVPRTEADLEVPRARALANPLYRGTLISVDGSLTTVTVEFEAYVPVGGGAGSGLAPLSGPQKDEAVRAVRRILDGFPRDDLELYASGEPILVQALQDELARDLPRFGALSLAVMVGLLVVIFRTWLGVLLPLTVVVATVTSALGVMALARVPIQIPTQILPSVLFAVAIGDSIHLLSIFFQQLRAGRAPRDAVTQAIRHSGLAIIFTSLTTAGGFASFASAELAPVTMIGVFTPIGVLFGLIYSLSLLPALLVLLGPRPAGDLTARAGLAERVLLAIGELGFAHPRPVLAGAAAFAALCAWSGGQLRFSHNILEWVPPEAEVRRATETVNRELGGATSLELVVSAPEQNGLHSPDLLRRMEAVATHLEDAPRDGDIFVSQSVSLVDVVKEIHQALNEGDPEFYVLPTDRDLIAQELLLFEASGTEDLEKLVDLTYQRGRLSMRVPWADAVGYSSFIAEVQAGAKRRVGDAAELAVTGTLPMLAQTATAMVISMARSYALSLILITPLMMLLIGSVRVGAIGMVPNVLPLGAALGLMGALGFPLDGFSMLIGGIILGVAVDDTIHFAHNFQRYYEAFGEAAPAIRETLRTTGRALFFTTVVLGLGFAVFAISSVDSLVRAGLLLAFAIVTALLADVLLVPALLALVYHRRERPA